MSAYFFSIRVSVYPFNYGNTVELDFYEGYSSDRFPLFDVYYGFEAGYQVHHFMNAFAVST